MCESLKALLAAQVAVLMLFGCVAGPSASTPHDMGVTPNSRPAATAPARSASVNFSTNNASPVVNQTLVKRGYQPRRIKGQLKYCRTQILTGTRFSNTVCLTQEEISATDTDTKTNLDTIGRAGRALCPNNKCD